MSLSIDWINNQILINSPQTDLSCQDLINFIREQEDTEMGISHDNIVEPTKASGKQALSGGVTVGITIELNSPWQLKFWEGSYVATITGGNLVGGLAGNPVAYSTGVQVLVIQSAASTIVTNNTGSGLSTEEHDRLYQTLKTGTFLALK